MPPPKPHQSAPTSVTLLDRLRDPSDEEAWRRFDALYRDLISRFLRSRGLQAADAEDVTQQVTMKLAKGMGIFAYSHDKGGFRAYLFRCTRSALADHFSRQATRGSAVSLRMDVGTEEHPGTQACVEERAAFEGEWVDHHYRLAVRRYREFADERGLAILDGTLAGRTGMQIAAGLGMTEAAVHKAQQRLRERLRDLIAEQLRDEEHGDEQPRA